MLGTFFFFLNMNSAHLDFAKLLPPRLVDEVGRVVLQRLKRLARRNKTKHSYGETDVL